MAIYYRVWFTMGPAAVLQRPYDLGVRYFTSMPIKLQSVAWED